MKCNCDQLNCGVGQSKLKKNRFQKLRATFLNFEEPNVVKHYKLNRSLHHITSHR